MRTTSKLAAAAALLCLVSACRFGGDPGASPAQAPPPEVGVVTLQARSVQLGSELPGRTSPYLVAEVRPQVGGILLERLFEEGSEVRAGQALYRIDPAPYRAALNRAEASLESARLRAERYQQLIQNHAISQQDHDDARSQYLQARADAENARIDLGYTRITAPISGRIGRSSVTQGALVTANQGDALATVQRLDPIYVDINQSSTALLRLKEDLASGRLKRADDNQAEVRLKLEDGSDYAHAGKLQFSEVSVDEGTGAVTLRAVFPNPDGLLLPGMFVRAQLQQGVREQALLVPQRGLTRDAAGRAIVMVVGEDGTIQPRTVTAERTVGSDWLISEGLSAGERVVVDGRQLARPGTRVDAVPADAVPADAVATAAAKAPTGAGAPEAAPEADIGAPAPAAGR